MIQKTEGIVLKYIKYGENQLIITCLTKQLGISNFYLKDAFHKQKKYSTKVYPLNIVELEFIINKNNQLNFLKNISNQSNEVMMYFNVHQSAIAFFLSQVIVQTVQGIHDLIVYDFLHQKITELKKTNHYSHFSWKFLRDFSKILGFFPNTESFNKNYFNLKEGVFFNECTSESLNGKDTDLWKLMLQNEEYDFSKEQRKLLIELLLKYYSFHISEFQIPKSLEVLQEMYN